MDPICKLANAIMDNEAASISEMLEKIGLTLTSNE